MRVSASRKVALVHLCMAVSIPAFPRERNYTRAETLLDERLFRARVVDLELGNTMKMASSDQQRMLLLSFFLSFLLAFFFAYSDVL